MFKVLGFVTKKEGIDTQSFIDHYETKHVHLICGLAPTPVVYKRNYLVRGDEVNLEDNKIDFDVVVELVFPDRAAFHAWSTAVGTGAAGQWVGEDERRFLDQSRTRAYVIEEHVTSA
jgi:hypothetical protein